jgi:hypothetical protein
MYGQVSLRADDLLEFARMQLFTELIGVDLMCVKGADYSPMDHTGRRKGADYSPMDHTGRRKATYRQLVRNL